MTAVVRWLPKRKGITALAFRVINELAEQRGAVVGGGESSSSLRTAMPWHRLRDTWVGEEEGASATESPCPSNLPSSSGLLCVCQGKLV